MTLVQGAGGNISVKTDKTLWIKASGTWLAKAMSESIFSAVALDCVRARIALGQADPASAELLDISPHGLRPSIETGLHALMPHAVVMHLHSVDAIALGVCEDGMARLSHRLEGLAWAWVSYVQPGQPLTEAIRQALGHAAVDVLVLANHGVVLGAESVASARLLLDNLVRRLRQGPHQSQSPAPAANLEKLRKLGQNTLYDPAPHPRLHAMATDLRQFAIATAGTLYPDHAVFLGPAAIELRSGQLISTLIAERAHAGLGPPKLLLVPEAGVLIRNDLSAGELAMLECLALVLSRIPQDASVRYLADTDVKALLSWDAEKYRRHLDQQQELPSLHHRAHSLP